MAKTKGSEVTMMDELVAEEKQPIGTEAKTGDKCPQSGLWKVKVRPSTMAPIAKKNLMPAFNDQEVVWRLIRHA